MKIPEKRKSKYLTKRNLIMVIAMGFLVVVTIFRVNSGSVDSSISADDVIISEVKVGDLVREIRAPGTLVPIDLRWIAARTSARVDEVFLEPGETVAKESVIAKLSNPLITQSVDAARYELDVLQAEYIALEKRLYSELLMQEAVVKEVEAMFEMAQFRSDANKELASLQIVPAIELKEAQLLEKQYKAQYEIELKKLRNLPSLHEAELAAKQARIDQSVRILSLQQEIESDLVVTAGFNGVIQEISIEKGQQVEQGTILARIAGQENLKAELRVQESQVKEVRVGQVVEISAGGNRADGVVKRIDPSVVNGVVIVDVQFTGDLLVGGRPDLRVDGVIELEKIHNVVVVDRPVFIQEKSVSRLFKLNKSQDLASKTEVKFGVGSVNRIQVLSGLDAGDKVVVSDTSRFKDEDKIKIN